MVLWKMTLLSWEISYPWDADSNSNHKHLDSESNSTRNLLYSNPNPAWFDSDLDSDSTRDLQVLDSTKWWLVASLVVDFRNILIANCVHSQTRFLQLIAGCSQFSQILVFLFLFIDNDYNMQYVLHHKLSPQMKSNWRVVERSTAERLIVNIMFNIAVPPSVGSSLFDYWL